MPALINLKGKRFGKLLITGDKITIKGRPSWPCLCDCGKECLKSSHLLLTGDAHSCGCSMGHPIKEIIGQKFGKLLVQELIRIDEKIFYRCLCDCGKITKVSANNLNRKKHTQSCGCSRLKPKKNFSIIEIKQDHSEILIESKKHGTLRVLIDTPDIPKIRNFRWYVAGKTMYVKAIKKGKSIMLHHLILPRKKGFIIDHKNRDVLDNRSSNLRYATYQTNSWNSFFDKRGFKGAYKKSGKWRSRIYINGKRKLIGDYSTKEEALSAYDQQVIETRGEFALTNSSNARKTNNPGCDDIQPDSLSCPPVPL